LQRLSSFSANKMPACRMPSTASQPCPGTRQPVVSQRIGRRPKERPHLASEITPSLFSGPDYDDAIRRVAPSIRILGSSSGISLGSCGLHGLTWGYSSESIPARKSSASRNNQKHRVLCRHHPWSSGPMVYRLGKRAISQFIRSDCQRRLRLDLYATARDRAAAGAPERDTRRPGLALLTQAGSSASSSRCCRDW
jgi:hypothetical protein